MTTVQHVFDPKWEFRAKIHGLRTIEQIQNEPMLFSAGLAFTEKVCLESGGGSTTWMLVQFLMDHVLGKSIEPDLNVVIDTRTHMLMKGMTPAIPGWHCDGLLRPEKYAQPRLESYDPRVRHYAAFFATEENVSRTVFMLAAKRIDVDPERVWGSVNEKMSGYGGAQKHELYVQKEGELMEFDEQTLHRASPCEVPGWRMFFRLSVTRDPVRDQIRKQTQVYTTANTGW
jgi:hypothetical protein